MLTITCVVDNTAERSSQLWAEHGVAFWITTPAGNALLDTGQSGTVLMHNLDELGLDPVTLDAVALSHAHYDHTGGLPALAKRIKPNLTLYANADLLRGRFSQHKEGARFIGLPVDADWLQAHFALHLSDAPQVLLPGISTTGAITERPHPQGSSARHLIAQGETHVPDAYRDDLSLVIETEGGLVVLCGCCHAGLLNTLEHVRRVFDRPIVAIAGGTHLVNADSAALTEVAETLADWGTRRVYLNHCSGENAYTTLVRILGDSIVRPCPAGTVLDIPGTDVATAGGGN